MDIHETHCQCSSCRHLQENNYCACTSCRLESRDVTSERFYTKNNPMLKKDLIEYLKAMPVSNYIIPHCTLPVGIRDTILDFLEAL